MKKKNEKKEIITKKNPIKKFSKKKINKKKSNFSNKLTILKS